MRVSVGISANAAAVWLLMATDVTRADWVCSAALGDFGPKMASAIRPITTTAIAAPPKTSRFRPDAGGLGVISLAICPDCGVMVGEPMSCPGGVVGPS
jgi:hypothetical protein